MAHEQVVSEQKTPQSGSPRLLTALERFALAGTLPDDNEDDRIRKATLTVSSVIIILLSPLWIVTYFVLGLPVPASIPLGYEVISIASLAIFLKTKRFRVFRFTQICLTLLLPFLLQISLGGFVAASGVILWSFTSPVGALLFYGRDRALPWFAVFAAVVVIAGVSEPFIDPAGRIPPAIHNAFFIMNILGPCLTTFLLVHYFVRQRDIARAALDEQHRLLLIERERSERLLLNVLPAAIAERLKSGEEVIADAREEVTVLFADIVGFTPLTASLAPEKVIHILNKLFSSFDDLAGRHGLEKIKTIGDAYMVAGGIPDPRDDHVEAVAEMALEMRSVIPRMARETGVDLDVRIGIDTGPVVAGVIGRRKFAYDLWGDAVNTASRMESHGSAGTIQVTDRVFERLNDRYEFTDGGTRMIKGKGEMRTFLLSGRRPPSSDGSGLEEGETPRREEEPLSVDLKEER